MGSRNTGLPSVPFDALAAGEPRHVKRKKQLKRRNKWLE